MGDLLKIVDSIAAAPTVRLDLNDESSYSLRSFDPAPPRLRRAMSSNAMRDGITVSSAQYDARVLKVELDLIATTQDAYATAWQTLARLLDRTDNYLMWQPTGATAPVFFNIYRSDLAGIEEMRAAKAFRRPTIEFLAEPAAYGIREDITSLIFSAKPSDANGLSYITGVIKGDLSTEAIVLCTSMASLSPTISRWLVASTAVSSRHAFVEAEAATLGGSATLPGAGGADVSGTGSNYVRSAAAGGGTLVMNMNPEGRVRLYARVRSSAGGTFSFTWSSLSNSFSVPVTTSVVTTGWTWIDMGLMAPKSMGMAGYIPVTPAAAKGVTLTLARTAGAGTVDLDVFALVPADESCGFFTSAQADGLFIIDGTQETVALNFGGTVTSTLFTDLTVPGFSGGFPRLGAGVTNRVWLMPLNDTSGSFNNFGVAISYYPRYLHVRPATT